MVKQAHLTQLIKGVTAWNQWRINYPKIRPSLQEIDLSGWNLMGANLQDVDLKGANLKGANLRKANLAWANLERADLSEADLTSTNLREAFLFRARLVNASLSEAELIGTDFEKANLTQANLSNCMAFKANFSSAILTGVCLQNWMIDEFTNLENVHCEYFYFSSNYQERRPDNKRKKLDVGEFSYLFKQALSIKNRPINKLFDYSNILHINILQENCT